jgi:hypothetical protein
MEKTTRPFRFGGVQLQSKLLRDPRTLRVRDALIGLQHRRRHDRVEYCSTAVCLNNGASLWWRLVRHWATPLLQSDNVWAAGALRNTSGPVDAETTRKRVDSFASRRWRGTRSKPS